MANTNNSNRVYGRHGSRWVALQALYAWQLSGRALPKISQDLIEENLYDQKISFQKEYLHELLNAIDEQVDELDHIILPPS